MKASASPRRRGGARRLAWRLHQWAGLQLSLYLTFVLATGALAVVAHEIDWLTRPAMWVTPTPPEERVPWSQVMNAARGAIEDGTVEIVYAPLHAAAPFDAVVRTSDGNRLHVYVHPATAEVTGTGAWFGVQRFLRDAHRRLMIMDTIGGVRIGIVLVCLSSVLLLVTLVTSLYVYKRWWRGFLRRPQGRDQRAFTGDLHRVTGVWSLWFVLLMTVTGLWYLAEEFGARPARAPLPPAVAERSEGQPVASIDELPCATAIDAGLATLAAAAPAYRVSAVLPPTERLPVLRVLGQDRALLVGAIDNTVWIDPASGRLLGRMDPTTLDAHQRIAAANNPLHFGTFGGLTTKLIWFAFGLLLTALAVTGCIVHALRLARQDPALLGWAGGLRANWQAMGRARWPAVALVVTPVVLAFVS